MSKLTSQEVKKNAIDVLCDRTQEMRSGEKKFLLGNVLTVIDSVIWDAQQRKAVKDIIEQLWYQKSYHWYLEDLLEEFRKKFTTIGEGETTEYVDFSHKGVGQSVGNYFSKIK